MLDQGFNAKNFRRIYDAENRKGRNVEEKFSSTDPGFDELRRRTASIKELKAALRDLISATSKGRDEALLASLADAQLSLQVAIDEKQALLGEHLERLALSISSDGHTLTLIPKLIPGGKTLYVSPIDPKTFFIEKQLQHNISRLYKISPGNRDVIVPQVMSFCGGNLPIWGVRTDISDFYESVDHKSLLRILKSDQLLDAPSIRYIQQILFAYRQLTNSPIGLPRGNGISAYLAELYMRPLDKAVRGMPDVLYYARYVDDIVVIFTQNPAWAPSDVMTHITDVAFRHGLTLNPSKTAEISSTDSRKARFNYLGYSFNLVGGRCDVDISPDKKARYQLRMEKSFAVYTRAPARKSKSAGRLLLKRIKFLTSNTRLQNSKSNAYVGTLYSNRYINKTDKYRALDALLSHRINQISDPRLRTKLNKYSFASGFSSGRFVHFTQTELADIVRIWKHA